MNDDAKIFKAGFCYRSKQNGLVVFDYGLCPCLGCGAHNGVEPKIVVYADEEN